MTTVAKPNTNGFLGLLVGALAGVSGVFFTPLVSAEVPIRWFEIEVILFTQNIPEGSIRETFEQQVEPIIAGRQRDLLTPYHYPAIKHLFGANGLCPLEIPVPVSIDSAPLDQHQDPLAQQVAQMTFDWSQYSEVMAVRPMPDDEVYSGPALPPWTGQIVDHCQYNLNQDPWFTPFRFMSEDRYAKRSYDYHYEMYPRVIRAAEQEGDINTHLMSSANFQLKDIYYTLRNQRNIRPILHTAWRQPVGGKSRARATRLYAGYDYSLDYDFQGQPRPATIQTAESPALIPNTAPETPAQTPLMIANQTRDDVIDNIERLLTLVDQGANINYQTQQIEPLVVRDNRLDPQQVREIDGLFNTYIDESNYLHIDAEFNVRREVSNDPNGASEQLIDGANEGTVVELPLLAASESNFNDDPNDDLTDSNMVHDTTNQPLKNYHFKQTRRVISKELHYFDHPYMGMIVQIRRWGW